MYTKRWWLKCTSTKCRLLHQFFCLHFKCFFLQCIIYQKRFGWLHAPISSPSVLPLVNIMIRLLFDSNSSHHLTSIAEICRCTFWRWVSLFTGDPSINWTLFTRSFIMSNILISWVHGMIVAAFCRIFCRMHPQQDDKIHIAAKLPRALQKCTLSDAVLELVKYAYDSDMRPTWPVSFQIIWWTIHILAPAWPVFCQNWTTEIQPQMLSAQNI